MKRSVNFNYWKKSTFLLTCKYYRLTTFMYRLDDMEEVEKKIELPGNKK